MTDRPSTNGADGTGRDASGKFTTGNKLGRGNPYAAHVARLRSALIEAVTEDDVRSIAETLVGAARGGDMAATKELLLRVLGRPVEADLIERLERLEAALAEGTPR